MKTSDNLKRTVVGTIATSVFITSCHKDYNLQNSLYSFEEDTTIEGINLLDIRESNLTEEVNHYINTISSILTDILTNQEKAKQFSDNPERYFTNYELQNKITITHEDKNMLKAFTDKDIIQAVRNNDIKLFLNQLKSKGYIMMAAFPNRSSNEIKSLFVSEKYLNELQTNFQFNTFNVDNSSEPTEEVASVVGVILAVVAITYVVAATIAVVEIAAAAQAAVYSDVGTYTSGSEISSVSKKLISSNFPVLKIWTDNNGPIAASDFYTEIIDEQVLYYMDIIKEQFQYIDTNKLASFLKNNLEGYYGLK